MDHYRTLEVEPSAGDSQLWSAYRRKALATHPDKGGSSEAFRAVETLIDAARRAAYDQLRAVPAPPAFPAAPVVPRRRSAARAGEVPRRAKEAWASGPKEAQKPEAEDAEDISAKPAKHQELLKKLLKKTRKEMFSELQALSEEESDLELVEQTLEGMIGLRLTLKNQQMVKPPTVRPKKAKKKKATSVAEGRPLRTRKTGRNLLKGVSCNRRDGSYQARISFNNFTIGTQYVKSLDAAVDMHICLVQMRRTAMGNI
ncbi:unnamed protein product [Durusdinium trenchii]|uniref:J domain-containing protein n=1 Tax=Durusdinium trenchii TaxID=1381693 RepID=A0ABP0SBK4_9DINO